MSAPHPSFLRKQESRAGRGAWVVGWWCRSERSEEPKAAAVRPLPGVSRRPPPFRHCYENRRQGSIRWNAVASKCQARPPNFHTHIWRSRQGNSGEGRNPGRPFARVLDSRFRGNDGGWYHSARSEESRGAAVMPRPNVSRRPAPAPTEHRVRGLRPGGWRRVCGLRFLAALGTTPPPPPRRITPSVIAMKIGVRHLAEGCRDRAKNSLNAKEGRPDFHTHIWRFGSTRGIPAKAGIQRGRGGVVCYTPTSMTTRPPSSTSTVKM